MRRRILAVGVAMLAMAGIAHAQNSRDITTPGYLVIRVILDGGSSSAPVGNAPFGGPGEGGSVDGSPGGFAPQPGAPGGPPGGAGPAGGGVGGFGGGRGGTGGNTTSAVQSIHVVAPFRSINFKPFFPDRRVNSETNPVWAAMKTKYGTTYLYSDDTSIQIKPIPSDTAKGTGFQTSLESPIRERYRKWSVDRKLEPIYELTVDALALGMIDEAFSYANETVKLYDVIKGDKDRKPSEKVTKFVDIWKATAPKLDVKVAGTNDAEEWRNRLSAGAVKHGNHYSIVYWGETQINTAVLDRRLNALERNMKAFFLWHALQGIAPSIPTKPFVVVLADRTSDVAQLREKLDGLPIQSDAFYSPAHDLLVLSPERLDQLGSSFTDMARASYKNGWSRDELLRGIPPTGGQKQSPKELARMMTLALVDKLLEEEMDHSAMSREATRQLYIATGIIPRHVMLPSWLESGLASFLQHPKGPVFAKDSKGENQMVVGLAYGYGAPNFLQHRKFRELDSSKELNPNPEVLLKNVLMDRYYEAAKTGTDIDPPPPRPQATAGGGGPPIPGPAAGGGGSPGAPFGGKGGGFGGPGGPPGGIGSGPGGPGGPPGGIGSGPGSGIGPIGGGGPAGGGTPENVAANLRISKEKIYSKAEATSWALVYYLSRSQMDGLRKFYAELNRMPRDMRLDETVVLKTFCKTFNLMDRQKVDQIDEAAFKNFAEMWIRSMRNVPVYGVELAMTNPGSSGGGGGNALPGGAGGVGP